MARLLVRIHTISGTADDPAGLAPAVMRALGLREGRRYRLRCGTRRATARFWGDGSLGVGRLVLPAPLARRLLLPAPLTAAVGPAGDGVLEIGPLVGLLTPRRLLATMQDRGLQPPYSHYVRFALEAGAVPVLFAPGRLDRRARSVRGCLPAEIGPGPRHLVTVEVPLPRVVFHAFNSLERPEAEEFESVAPRLGCLIVDGWQRIPKPVAYDILRQHRWLDRHVPATDRLTPQALRAALSRYDDLYLKPDAGARGEGVYRLTQARRGWVLTTEGNRGPLEIRLPDRAAVLAAVRKRLARGTPYLLQEGLPLATFLGNRFDLRALAQKNGRGRWVLAGLAARVAPPGSPITSPLRGALVARPVDVLRLAFPGRWHEVLNDVHRVVLAAAEAIDRALGPRFEIGVDIAVLQDGTIKIIEVNGAPRKTSLEMLRDPLIAERVYRLPIHYAIGLALRGDG
ncbi:MAG TPA: YheC/YheD family protein [Thermaerobacter sp.]